VLYDFSLRSTSTAGLLWVLEAAEGISYGSGEPMLLRDMRVRFYDGQQQVRSVLTSKRGEVESLTQSLLAQDSVVVWTPVGETLRTESLRWDPGKERITTDVFFRLARGRDVLTGIGLEADPDLEHYSVQRSVRAEVRDQDDRKILEEMDRPGGTDGGSPGSR